MVFKLEKKNNLTWLKKEVTDYYNCIPIKEQNYLVQNNVYIVYLHYCLWTTLNLEKNWR